MRGQRTVRERSEYSMTVFSPGSAREGVINNVFGLIHRTIGAEFRTLMGALRILRMILPYCRYLNRAQHLARRSTRSECANALSEFPSFN